MSFRIQRYDLLRRGTMDCSDDGTLFTCVDMGDNGFYGCLNSKSDCDPCQDDCSSDLKAWYPSEQPPVGNTDEVHCHDSSTPYFCQAPEQPFFGCCKSDPCASNICNNADVVAMYVASSLIATATDSIDAIAAPTDSPNTDSSGTSPSDTNPSSADSSSIPFTSTDSSSTTSSTTSSPSTNHPIPGPSGIASISQVSGLVSIPVTTSKLPSKTTVFSQVAATTSESSSTPQPTATSHASGAGVIAGATIGGLACLALIGALALLFYCRSKLSRKHMNDIGPLPNAPNPVSTPKQDLPDPPPNSKQGLEEPPMLASGIGKFSKSFQSRDTKLIKCYRSTYPH